jgi:hypothetical protein
MALAAVGVEPTDTSSTSKPAPRGAFVAADGGDAVTGGGGVGMSRVGEQPLQPQAGKARERLRQRPHALGDDPRAMEAGVHLDADVQPAPRGLEGRRERARALFAVDAHDHPRAPGEGQQPLRLARTDDRVGDEEVVAAGGLEEGLGLADLRDGEAGGPEGELQARDLGVLVGLGVRAQAYARAAGGVGHARHVRLQARHVDHDRGRVEVVFGHARA